MKHKISKSASNQLWSIAKNWFPKLIESRALHSVRKKIPQFKTVRAKMYKENVPEVRMEVAYEVKETGDVIILKDLTSTPLKKFHPHKYTKLYESASIKVQLEKETTSTIYYFTSKCKKNVCICEFLNTCIYFLVFSVIYDLKQRMLIHFSFINGLRITYLGSYVC